MAGELNTEVHDDPESCRATADWYGRAVVAVGEVGDAVYRERGESESFWVGTAGDAARRSLTDQGQDSDKLRPMVEGFRRALETFAGTIDTVRARMDQARQVATSKGLVVTPIAILPPGPGPGTPPAQPDPAAPPEAQQQYGQQLQAHQAALQAYQEKADAWAEVTGTVAAARGMQQQAHDALQAATRDPLETVKTLKTYTYYVVSGGLMHVKVTQTTANGLLQKSTDLSKAASTMQARAETMTYSPAMRELAEDAAAKGRQLAADTHAQYLQTQKLNGWLPEWARSGIESNPANWIRSGSKVATLSKGALRGLPVVGTALAVGSGAVDVGMGKDPLNATEDTAASLGGSIAGGAAAGAALGTIFPGPGNVIGGVVGGIAGSLAATGIVDSLQGDDE